MSYVDTFVVPYVHMGISIDLNLHLRPKWTITTPPLTPLKKECQNQYRAGSCYLPPSSIHAKNHPLKSSASSNLRRGCPDGQTSCKVLLCPSECPIEVPCQAAPINSNDTDRPSENNTSLSLTCRLVIIITTTTTDYTK